MILFSIKGMWNDMRRRKPNKVCLSSKATILCEVDCDKNLSLVCEAVEAVDQYAKQDMVEDGNSTRLH